MKKLLASFCIAALLPAVAVAEVVNKAASGFSLKIMAEVPVEPREAYDEFIVVSDWWIKSHTWWGHTDNLFIVPRAGGCFCEILGDHQALHMTVTYVEPGRELKMTGGLGPLQMMGIHGGMSWRFEPTETGTRITLSYNVTGYAEGGLTDLADIVDAVLTSQVNSLASHVREAQSP